MNTFGTKIKVGEDEDGSPVYHSPHEYNDTLTFNILRSMKIGNCALDEQ
jgi:hypothetical protein